MTGFGTLVVRSGLPRDATTGALVEPVNPHLALNEAVHLPLCHLFPRLSRVTRRRIYLFALSQPQPRKPRLIAVTLVNDIQTEMANILDNCENTGKMVWIETPTVADIAHESGSLLVVDNTFLPPYIQNASTIAQILAASPHVLAVNYPGLSTHPQREIAVKEHPGRLDGGMISFLIRGGREAARRFCESSRLFTLAESLGGVERLCEVPAAMTHCGMAKEVREEGGIFENLVRLSVGVENVEDLKVDLVWALEEAVAVELGRS
ncbi:pyridoxal phosphate-dependent transferase [Aspergillus transmontanensis]|nr:pyridoxal phosphate-dependent transferase [Aspergillus transmontanensis]